MTADCLQRIFRQLGNSRPVRYYMHLNYPQTPQLMGIEIFEATAGGCWRQTNGSFMLEREMLLSGFAWDPRFKMWTAVRHEEREP